MQRVCQPSSAMFVGQADTKLPRTFLLRLAPDSARRGNSIFRRCLSCCFSLSERPGKPSAAFRAARLGGFQRVRCRVAKSKKQALNPSERPTALRHERTFRRNHSNGRLGWFPACLVSGMIWSTIAMRTSVVLNCFLSAAARSLLGKGIRSPGPMEYLRNKI